ncbi:4'-phosphopantetheinyl transferase family protein [Candidatus Avelusimicrobium sp.]
MSYKTQFVKIKDLPPANSFLSPGELAYLQTLRAEKRKGDWLGGRFALKVLLAREDNLLPLCSLPSENTAHLLEMSDVALALLKQIEIVKLPSGAPQVIIGGVADKRSVSITHSHGWAVAAVADAQTFLGIDLEKIETRSRIWAEEFFLDQEKGPATDEHLTRVWTQKEAVVKLLGRGLSLSTREIILSDNQVQFVGRAKEAWLAQHRPQIILNSTRFDNQFIFTTAYAAARGL